MGVLVAKEKVAGAGTYRVDSMGLVGTSIGTHTELPRVLEG